MRLLLSTVFVGIGCLTFADDAAFIQAYDAERFDVAAGRVQDADMSNPGVARRVGVMYFNGKGVKRDQAKGRELLEQAMMAGDAMAAINLAKIYFKIEKNVPKAAWCLMVAECSGDVSVQPDVIRLRECLGENYLKGVLSYITQLRGLLADEQMALRTKDEKYGQERSTLTEQISSIQGELKKKSAAWEREREVLLAEQKKQENVLAAVKANSEREMEAAQKDIAGYRRIIKTMEVGSLTNNAETEKISAGQIYARYNQLVEKYNVLVSKYNGLLRASGDSSRKRAKE